MEEQTEKILFQYIMNYKAYRRKMIIIRVAATLVVAGSLCGLCAKSVILGILLAAIALFFGSITILVSFGNEQAYTVYNTRVVIKVRGNDKRKFIPTESIVGVKYRRAFYERDLATGTVTLRVRTEKGGIKKYRLKHIFDAKPLVEYLNDVVSTRGKTENEN